MAQRLKVQTMPAILILNYKGNILAQASGFQAAAAFGAFLDPYLTLFKSDPLGGASPDPFADEVLQKALQDKPAADQIPASTLYYCLLDQSEITLQKDGSAHTVTRRALYMANPDLARNADDVSGFAVRYDASREKLSLVYARIIDALKQAYSFDFAYVHDKPAVASGDVTWDEHRLVAPSARAQKGQVFDYKTVRDSKAIIPGHFEFKWPIHSDQLLEVSQKLIIHFPPELGLSKSAIDCDVPVIETTSPDGTITWEIDSSSVPKNADTLFVPNPSEGFRGYHFYTPSTWDDLATWYNSQNAGHDKLPSEAVDLVAKIKKENTNPQDQAFAVYRWVVDNIHRYNVDFQESPLQAHPVDMTFHYLCGDIKDQTLLLIALLREAGFQADPVLLKKGYGSRFDEKTPMISQFDHVIVAAKIDGKDVYFDAGAPETAVAGWLPVSDSNVQALKVAGNKAEIITLPMYQARTDLAPAVAEETALHPDGSAVWTAHYTYRGAMALRMKSIFASLPLDKAREAFAMVFKKKGNITLTDFSMSPPTEKGDSFTIMCVADVPKFATVGPGGLSFTLGTKPMAESWSSVLSRPRSEPLRFYPEDPVVDKYEVTMPPGMKVVSKPDDFNLDKPYLTSTETSTVQGDKLEMIITSATKDAVVPVDQQDEVKSTMQQIENHHEALFVLISDSTLSAVPSPMTPSSPDAILKSKTTPDPAPPRPVVPRPSAPVNAPPSNPHSTD